MPIPFFATHLDIFLLGRICIRAHKQELSLPTRYRKALGLLGFLASERDKPHSRDYLASLFWPNLNNSAARSNLRQVLSSLNQVLSSNGRLSPLQACRHNISFQSDAVNSLDLITLEQPLPSNNSCRHGECRLQAWLAHEVTPNILSADFLPAYTLPECEEFELWLTHKREQLRIRQQLLLQRLITCSQRCGAAEQALDYAHLLIKIDPDNEIYLRQAMNIHASMGQSNAALNLFDAFARRLQRELALVPESATLAIRDSLLQQSIITTQKCSVEPSHFPVIQKVSLVVILRVQWLCQSANPEESAQRLYDLNQMTIALLDKALGAFHQNSPGKGSFYYFGWPEAVADAALLAWRAALRLSSWGEIEKDINVRVGIHCGRLFSSLDDVIPDLLGEITEETTALCHNIGCNLPVVSDKLKQLLEPKLQFKKLHNRRRQSDGNVQALYHPIETRPLIAAVQRLPGTREQILQQLSDIWQTSSLRLAAILADAGMGKTVLVTQWLARQPVPEQDILRLHCYPDLQHAPLETLFYYLESSHPSNGSTTKLSLLNCHQLPGYAQWFNKLNAENALKNSQKDRLFSRLASMLVQITPAPAALYWLEDVHYCDLLTLEFFIYLASQGSRKTLVLATGCRIPAPVTWPGHRLSLLPLSSSECLDMLQELQPERISLDHQQQLIRLSGGSPLALKLLANNQSVDKNPDALLALFSPSIDGLGKYRELALILAIAGTQTPNEDLITLLDDKLSNKEILQGIATMIECGLLCRVTKTRCRFTHPLIPGILQELTPPSQIRRIRQVIMRIVQ